MIYVLDQHLRQSMGVFEIDVVAHKIRFYAFYTSYLTVHVPS